MNRPLVGIVVGVVVAAILLFSACYIVQPSERALVLQLGNPVRVDQTPGLYFKIPFVQNVDFFDSRVLNYDAPSEEVPTVDLKQVDVSSFAVYRIIDPLLFYQTVNNEIGVQGRLGAIMSANLRQVLGNVSMAAILTQQRAQFMQEIAQRVNNDTKSFGIQVIDVRIKRVDLPPANSQAIFRRMQTQREQEARKIRAEGQKDAVTLRAEADKQAVVIVANARKQSEILRGEGDGTASAVYAASYGRDPAFFDFYRSMQALTIALPSGTTSYVGPADGDFFRYFLGNSYNPEAPPAPAAAGNAANGGVAGSGKTDGAAAGTTTSP
jgi:modulator of FtsH protease HflC